MRIVLLRRGQRDQRRRSRCQACVTYSVSKIFVRERGITGQLRKWRVQLCSNAQTRRRDIVQRCTQYGHLIGLQIYRRMQHAPLRVRAA
jgi:hypothetical protein